MAKSRPTKYAKTEQLLNQPYREITVQDQPIIQYVNNNNNNTHNDNTENDTQMSSKGEIHTISMLHRTKDITQLRQSLKTHTNEYDAAMQEYRVKRLAEKRAIRAARHNKTENGITNTTKSTLTLPTKSDSNTVNSTEPSVPATNTVKHQRKKDESVRQLERLQRKQARLQAQQQTESHTDTIETDTKQSNGDVQHTQPIIDKQQLNGSTVMILDSTSSESESSSSDSGSSSDTDTEQLSHTKSATHTIQSHTNDKITELNVDTTDRPAWMYRGQQIDQTISTPVNELHTHYKFDSRIVTVLQQHNIHTLFAMQSTVIPIVNRVHDIHDICICSPTGTGKTLCYVIPIIQQLSQRITTQLRCIVVLPTRDLAVQVYSIFNWFADLFKLNVVLSIGQTSFEFDQQCIVEPSTGTMLCDILICTPGRLIEHIHMTPQFNLSYVHTLVLDEVDRLLTQQYSDFIYHIMNHTSLQTDTIDNNSAPLYINGKLNIVQRKKPVMQKLLLSATLTTNPQKLASLYLTAPLFYTETKYDKVYKVPSTLTEYCIQCSTTNKAMKLILLLQQLQTKQILIFTKSVDSTHRLYRLLELYGIQNIAEYSSVSNHTTVLQRFNKQQINILVCSDAMARGMDFNTVIDCVIQYDVPIYIRTYIHRVGRTARAGNTGIAYTLCRDTELKKFQQLVSAAENSNLQSHAILDIETVSIKEQFLHTLQVLKYVLDQEKYNKIDSKRPLKHIDTILKQVKYVVQSETNVDIIED